MSKAVNVTKSVRSIVHRADCRQNQSGSAMRRLSQAIVVVAFLAGCVTNASGPRFGMAPQDLLAAGQARIHVFRDKVPYLAQAPGIARPEIALDERIAVMPESEAFVEVSDKSRHGGRARGSIRCFWWRDRRSDASHERSGGQIGGGRGSDLAYCVSAGSADALARLQNPSVSQ